MTDALAWALVHFLWQGAALAGLAWVLMRLASSASLRYGIGVATMAAMVTAVVATTMLAGPAAEPVAAASASIEPSPVELVAPTLTIDVTEASPSFALPTTWILAAWALGVLLLSVRVLGGWWVARRLARTAVQPLSAELQALALMLARRLNIRRVVRVVESSRVAVPVMIGWIRPVVLLPPAALAGLSVSQVEAILAHEFAHIRRHDYLVNLFQTVVETALFFHPAVWWISREVRRERELCCDDIAVDVCDRLIYATALSTLAHLRPPSLALAATDGSLRDRIRRIVSSSPSSESAKGGWMALLPLLLVVTLAAPSAYSQVASRPVVTPPEVKEIKVDVEQPTTPPKSVRVTVPTKTDRMIVTTPRPAQRRIEVAPESPEMSVEFEAARQRRQAQAEIEMSRLAIERERLQNEAELEHVQGSAELKKQEIELTRLRNLVDKGLATRESMMAAEQELTVLAARAKAAHRERELQTRDLELRERELMLERQAMERTPISSLAATELIQAGDQLRIVIEGEPDLPTTYAVPRGGAVRLPLIGTVNVQGLTVSQAQAAVEKLLASKNIANARVTVSATRR